MFIFKRNKVVLDTFTDNVNVFHYAKPEKAIRYFPEWWKTIPVKTQSLTPYGLQYDIDTMASCPGFIDHFKNSIVLPLWSDLIIETSDNGDYKYKYADDSSPPIVSHSDKQYGFFFQDKIHLKICYPWLFQEKTGINFVCVEPTWNLLNKEFPGKILPGTVQYQMNVSGNINMFFPKINNRIKLEFGTPLYQLFPQSEKDIEIKTHLVSSEEYKNLNKISSYRFKFNKNYSFKKKTFGTCPFNSILKK
jgi:hypothetical protein